MMTTKENSIMNRNLKTAATIAALGAAALLSGCAFVPMTVHSHYTPPANVAKVPGADKVVVDVVVKNEKKHKNEISVTKDGYDIGMAGVYMHVDKDFKYAIDKALAVRGFKAGSDGGAEISVTVKTFFLKETNGFSGITHIGNLNILVDVRNDNGQRTYSRDIVVNNFKQKLGAWSLSTGRNSSANKLLNIGVNKLVSDDQFIHALMVAGDSHTNG
jgi:uncharacterized lipoprotein YajG